MLLKVTSVLLLLLLLLLVMLVQCVALLLVMLVVAIGYLCKPHPSCFHVLNLCKNRANFSAQGS